jgi:hypothetical protein
MQTDHVEELLERLNSRQQSILNRLEDMDQLLHDLIVELGGIPGSMGRDPNRVTIRGRLHKLEADRTAARTAEAAINAARELRNTVGERRFNRRERILGLVFAALVIVSPFIAQAIAR